MGHWAWEADTKFRITWLSDEFEPLSGHKREDFLRLGEPGGPELVRDATRMSDNPSPWNPSRRSTRSTSDRRKSTDQAGSPSQTRRPFEQLGSLLAGYESKSKTGD